MKAQKNQPNRALKMAIAGTGKTSRFIAMRARIPEGQFSKFVTGRAEPTPEEKDRIVATLKKYDDDFNGSITDLFPADAAVPAA